ncbi:hypothetical protein DRQ25_12135 [Candidatus Fermentibacteria bacterium]|nr:MAG: hypothetical protein DRQ25_12135 [Candidatus Fermentibacteria bacterium]
MNWIERGDSFGSPIPPQGYPEGTKFWIREGNDGWESERPNSAWSWNTITSYKPDRPLLDNNSFYENSQEGWV